jgi:hypothetical protein
METEGMELEIIINPKVNDDGQAVVQLETAAGAAIKHFKNAHGINVPRSRFLPVKSCSDLLLIKSDIYSLQHGQLVINPLRMFETTPVIKLGDHFKKIQQFQKRFKKIPQILELDHLTVTGDVNFGRNVTLRGTVIGEFELVHLRSVFDPERTIPPVVANEGQRIDIPDGCILENRLLSGNLNMIVSRPLACPPLCTLLTFYRFSFRNCNAFFWLRDVGCAFLEELNELRRTLSIAIYSFPPFIYPLYSFFAHYPDSGLTTLNATIPSREAVSGSPIYDFSFSVYSRT